MNIREAEEFITGRFGVLAEHLWMKYPEISVFRNSKNGKWFAVIMSVEKGRLGLEGEGKADIINLKCDPALICSLRHNEGYLPAYHMNKTYWISVLLDGSAKDEEVKDLIQFSYGLIDSKKR